MSKLIGENSQIITFNNVINEDNRGTFQRIADFSKMSKSFETLQVSLSTNLVKGTLRGLHFQGATSDETKLVCCLRGRIFDVLVDIREDSPERYKWKAWELGPTCENRSIVVPKGFAHGFYSLEDETEVLYLIDTQFIPDQSFGIRFDDPILNIDWPGKPVSISEKDLRLPNLG